jgi:hypothetical protein
MEQVEGKWYIYQHIQGRGKGKGEKKGMKKGGMFIPGRQQTS